jgi:hypothetical protein
MVKKVFVVILVLAVTSLAFIYRPSGIGQIANVIVLEQNGRSLYQILVNGIGEYKSVYLPVHENPLDNQAITGLTGRRFDARKLARGQIIMYWLDGGILHTDPPIASYSRLWIIRK